MSENQFTCDDTALEAMLRSDQSSEPSEELLAHVETCTRCQERISELAGPTAMWHGVKAAISEAVGADQQRRFSPVNLDQSAIHWTESMAKQLLSPPSHPEMLGRLGRYEVERLIGSGGMGVVFKAFDTELNRPVAIKLLAPYLASSGPARKRFAREARAAAAVVHLHVVPIHNVETERESPFIVMQYVSGESLQARIDRDGPLELCEILRIGMQVADGLSAAHQQGIVHRDIKPSNILLEEDVDRALISDFGLARAADDASLTRTGFHPGTPQYMSPEQASGQSIDARSDLFSLGSMLYTMCTGRPPFRAENSLSVMRRISESEPTPIQEINPSIPEWMCAVITQLMAKNVKDRLSSAAEVRGLLEALLSHVQQPLSSSLPTFPWLITPKAKPKASESNRSWPKNMKTLVLGNSLFIGILAFLLLPNDPASVQQTTASNQGIPDANGGLSQEAKTRLDRLIKDNPMVVVGTLQEGKPTGNTYAHVFTTSQILKGNPVKLNVLFSHKTAVDTDGPLPNQNTSVGLPQLNAGEYVLVVEAVEVISSFAVSSFGLLVTPEKTFNHFIVRDGEQHSAWPLDSPEAAYIRRTNTMADLSQRSLPSVSTEDLAEYEAMIKDPQYSLMKLLAEDRDKAEALIRAGQKQRPDAHLWAVDIQTLFAADQFTGKSLQGKARVAHFKHALEYLQESYDITVEALKKAPKEQLQYLLPGLQIDLAHAALEANETELAKQHGSETLQKNTDDTNDNYGNIIHNANQILGRCVLREGKLADAKAYLLKAGATPGSPQLKSFGPQLQLARELLEKGEKESVLQYLDLVSKFWASDSEESALGKQESKVHAALIEGWKREISEGKIPIGSQWL
jgi:serine/threonine protein kinase